MRKVTIVDYGSGNVLSAQKSFIKVASESNIETSVLISKNLKEIKSSTHIVLPGQGAFSTCMSGLRKTNGLIEELHDFAILRKRPFLGICVGMQMLAKDSEENGIHKGLGWIDGNIKPLPKENLKMPHMGWNLVTSVNSNNNLIKGSEDFYFVHSYYFKCQKKEDIMAETQYGINFTSIVAKENIYGVQFHPEKSSSQGLSLIKNFLKL